MRGILSPISGFLSSCQRISLLTHSLKPPSLRYWRFNSTISSAESATCFKCQWIDDVERLERYQLGGYHPVLTGDLLADRYRVVHKLGYGTYSTIWLAHDRQRAAYVAVKISTADAPSREVEILRTLTNSQPDHPGWAMIPRIQNQFVLQGPNGCHRCHVEFPARSSVATAKFCCCFKIETARVLVTQLILAVAYTHARGFVHGDIHLGNVLLGLPSSFDQLSTEQFYKQFGEPYTEELVRLDGKPLSANAPPYGIVPVWLGKDANMISSSEAHLLLGDFGEAFSPATQQRLGEECHAPLPALPPEVLFDPKKPLSFPSDIWTLACAIWSILGMRSLFDDTLATRDDIGSQQVDILGPSSFPSEWWGAWEARHKYFDEANQPKKGRTVLPSLERLFQEDIQSVRREEGVGEFNGEEVTAILTMLRAMFVFKPEERATSASLMVSEWMMNWGLPEFDRLQKIQSKGALP